ncbi:MAG: hypothetical protein M1536_07995 [Firmicutes bacterium]|nr:hypothetical protein [Bacillota bacterium]
MSKAKTIEKIEKAEFQDFFKEIPSIKLKEPLAEVLGAVKGEALFEYSFSDVVKFAGHACPTVAGAYLITLEGLKALYKKEIPVRGEIAVTIRGGREEAAYGPISQVISYITGAAPETGFKGMMFKYKRQNLLKFNPESGRKPYLVRFKDVNTGKQVEVEFSPEKIPALESDNKIIQLFEKVIWNGATPSEKEAFKDAWTGKVKRILIDRSGIENWLKTKEI